MPYVYKVYPHKELECLVVIGVLEHYLCSEWGLPLFIISKLNRIVRFLTNL